jgi:hypothetical protein
MSYSQILRTLAPPVLGTQRMRLRTVITYPRVTTDDNFLVPPRVVRGPHGRKARALPTTAEERVDLDAGDTDSRAERLTPGACSPPYEI